MFNSLTDAIFSHTLIIGLTVILVGALFILEAQHNTKS